MTQLKSQTLVNQTQTQSQIQIAELMKPIKDLAQVWQIDITPYIDSFAVQLTNELIQNIDFREAAIIIQQTTALFAKKVDFLYEFVNQILVQQPGKQKRRRTTLVQANDLVLNYDYENLNDTKFSEFFQIYNMENPKIVQKKNLYLLPKQPYTVLQTRKEIVENSDIRISPIYNAIQQDYVFLLEQWDRNQLSKILENDVNAQPINYITPIHPKYINMSDVNQVHDQQSQEINAIMFQPQIQTFDDQAEQIQLINSQVNIDINQDINEPQDVEINVINDVMTLSSNSQHEGQEPQNEGQQRSNKIKICSIKEFIKNNPLNKNSSQQQLKENLDAFQSLLNQHYAKLQQNICSEVNVSQMKRGFQKIQLDNINFSQNNIQLAEQNNFLVEMVDEDDSEIEIDDIEDIEPFCVYYAPKNLFNSKKSQSGIIKKYMMLNSLIAQQAENSQANVFQALAAQSDNNQQKTSEQPNIQQVPIQSLPQGADGLDNVNPIFFTELQFDGISQQRSQQGEMRYSQQTQHKRPARFIYSHEYVVWVRNLQEQLESATKFDVMQAKNDILEKCQDPVDIQTLSKTMKVEVSNKQTSQKTNQIKLARCFMSSLFLASEGKISFDNDQQGKLLIKQNH